MTERELAQQLSVGRSSVREVITAMRIQGMVDVRHGDGSYLLRRPEDLIASLATELVEAHVDHPYIGESLGWTSEASLTRAGQPARSLVQYQGIVDVSAPNLPKPALPARTRKP